MKNPNVSGARVHKTRRWIWLGGTAVVVVGAAVAFGLTRGGGDAAKAAEAAKKKEVVPLEFVSSEVTQPALTSLPLTIEFSGPLVAPRTAIVRAKAAGTLLSLAVAEGSRVRPGQVIGEIDLSDLQSRVTDRSALVESAQAGLLEAERQHTANVGLAAQSFISATALQSSQAKLDAARAQLKSAQAQLSTSRLTMKEATLAAPIGGIVGKRYVVPGEKVSAEQQIVSVVDLSTLELAGSVGTHEVSLLKPGQAVRVTVEGQAGTVAGRIDRIAPAAEAGTRAIGVVVVLENRDEQFRAGQYAQATAKLADTVERLTVPTTAVGQASGQDFVWALEKGALVRRIVITGRRDAVTGRTEISKGLEPGTQVLAVRFDNLKEGAPAGVVAQRATPASPSASASSVPAPAAART